MTPAIVVCVVFLCWLACLTGGLYWLNNLQHSADGRPVCGKCSYDLTGAPGNRCPECGTLFIEAGVTFTEGRRGRARRRFRLVMIALSVILVLAILLPALYLAAEGVALIRLQNAARQAASQPAQQVPM